MPPQVHHGFVTPQGPPPPQQQAAIPGFPMGMAAHPSMGPPAPAPTFDPNTPVEEREFDAICQVPVGSIVALVGGGQRYKPVSLSDLPATAPEPVTLASANEFLKQRLATFYQKLDEALGRLRGESSRFVGDRGRGGEGRRRSRSKSPRRQRSRSRSRCGHDPFDLAVPQLAALQLVLPACFCSSSRRFCPS